MGTYQSAQFIYLHYEDNTEEINKLTIEMVYFIILILDGNSENVAYTGRKKSFRSKPDL